MKFEVSTRLRKFLEVPGTCIRLFGGVVCLCLLASCGGGDDPAQVEEAPPPGQTVLQCTDACAGQGQCGQAADGRQVVLGHLTQPETRNHNLVFPVDVPVVVQLQNQQTVRTVTGEEFLQGFSQVTVPDTAKTGWVADWCVVSPGQ